MSENIIVNTALTLSINSSPGQDKRFPSLSTESIFTFGDFRLQRNLTPNVLSGISSQLSFSNFGTINSLSNEEMFDSTTVLNTTVNDLNPKKDDANSYAYFSSFYTKVATAINNIVENFPYGMFIYDGGTGTTILNYTNVLSGSSTFNIPTSAITNQGNVVYASGYTASTSTYSLFNDYTEYEIELSSSTRYSASYPIQVYYHSGNTGMMTVVIDGQLFSANTASTSVGFYILPSQKRYYAYKKTLSNLEYQLLFEQRFMVPNPDDDTFESTEFEWPKTIDGFNPDGYGDDFDEYAETLLRSCSLIDEIKTNWMVRTMLPENYLELDSDGEIYRKLTVVYAEEFDKIKQYIDGIAFAHSVTYSNEEAIPDKFIHRLSKLLGWEPINEFNDVDIFEYLAKEDDNGYTVSDYNLELWKKILININWLYKKKGTREGLEFIFKLMGAPNCLINFNELIYRVQQSATGVTNSNYTSLKVDDDTGYPNYEAGSQYIFQEGGPGRGDGDEYIRQWEPEYQPIREVDNIKVYTGNSEVYGTSNIMNSKQVNIELSPAAAIECDTNSWYDLNQDFESIIVGLPDYVNVGEVAIHVPLTISGMSMANWLDYVYTNAVDPKKHKIIGYDGGHHNYFYSSLRDIYLTYYYWNNPGEVSNQLNFRKLEAFLALVGRNFGGYIERLIPATTIIEGEGVLYRNTMFNRQKFVYPPGINNGSEFQIPAPISPDLEIFAVEVNAQVNDVFNPQVNAVEISSNVNECYQEHISAVQVTNDFILPYNPTINGVVVSNSIDTAVIETSYVTPEMTGIISPFPSTGTPIAQPAPLPTPYRTRRNVLADGASTDTISAIA